MDRAERAVQCIDRIYEAAVEQDLWQRIVEDVSGLFGGASVALGLPLPGEATAMRAYYAHLDARFTPIFVKHLREGTLPWGSLMQAAFRAGLASASEFFPDSKLPETDFYREWMQPQGLAPEGPLAHTISARDGSTSAGIAIYRRRGGRVFTDEDLATGDRLVPHLRRGCELTRRFADALRREDALCAVIDRLPQGIILLAADQRVVSVSRRAEQIAALDDGFQLGPEGPRAGDPRDQEALRDAIERTLRGVTGLPHQNVLTIRRRSGRPGFGVLVSRLVGPPRSPGDAALAIFVGDPDAGNVSTTEILRGLYGLTEAEADLVRLIAEGHSLDEAARERGVTRNTARTQLKQIFAKTGTHRQGDLVRLVLSGIASIRED